MKIDKLIYDVREQLNQFIDDTEISDRYILYLYGIKRSKYLRQALNNYQKTADNSIQQTLCVALEEIPNNECNVDVGCDTLLRTVSKIPTPLELDTKVAINSIKPTIRTAVPFNFISKNRISMLEGARFQKAIYSFIDTDGYIYVTAGQGNEFKLLNCLTITGVFEDPLELVNFSDCCGCEAPNTCFDYATSEYPLQPHYIDLIREEIVNALVKKLQIPEDRANNSTDV